MPECDYCRKPCVGKFCPGNGCKNKAWRQDRDIGHALIEDGVISRDEARIYLAVRDRARRACNEATETEPLTVDMRGCFRKGSPGTTRTGKENA